MRNRYVLILMIVSMAVSVLAGCGPRETARDDVAVPTPVDDPEPGIAQGGILLTGGIGDAGFLNPILASDNVSGIINNYIFEGLLTTDADVNIQPRLAVEWSSSPDELVWTIKMRQDVYFHDGHPLTARDVKFTYDSVLYPTYTGPRESNFNRLKGAQAYIAQRNAVTQKAKDEGLSPEEELELKLEAYADWLALEAVKVLSDYSLRIELEMPFSPFLTNTLTFGILPYHILKDAQGADMATHEFNRNPIGSGPFIFNGWSSGEYISVVRNPNHWGHVPHLDEIVYKVIPDANTLEAALESAELDLAAVQHESFDRFVGMQHLDVIDYSTFSYTYMGLDQRNPLFQDVRVRRALAHAINKEVMVNEIFQGLAAPAHSHGHPVRWDYNPDVAIYEYAPDLAKNLLQEAGWTPGPDGILMKDGQRFSFTLQTNEGNKAREMSAVIIQNNLEAVGIEMQIQLVEWPTFVQQVLIGRNFEACIVGWALGTDPDAHTIFHTNAGTFNFVTYSNPRVDELIDRARTVSDQDVRAALYGEMQGILADELPYIWLFFPAGLRGLNRRVLHETEFTASPTHSEGLAWNVWYWYIPEKHQGGPIVAP